MAPVSAEEISEREAYVKCIQDYQVKIQSDIATVLERLQWTPQHFLEQESAKVTCSYCPDHKMPVESLKKHEEVCKWIQKGYTHEELRNEIASSSFFYEKSKVMTIKLEKEVINSTLDEHHRQMGSLEIKNLSSRDRDVPQTLAASKTYFSQSERLALYEYVNQTAKESQQMQLMSEDSLLTVDFEALIKKSAKAKEAGEPYSEAEKWAAMRDYKRRRQSYRAKNVHITKKTYTEIIREVIHNQVDLLQEVIKNEENNRENKSKGDSSSKSNRVDSERKAKRNHDSSYKTQTGSSSRRRDWESPDRRRRESNRVRDHKSPGKWRRDRDSPDPRKRDHKSPESRSRSKDSPDQRRNRSSPYSRKRDRKSPDTRKREKEDIDRRSRKTDFDESCKKRDRENLEGVSRSKSPDHKKRNLECESFRERHELEAPLAKSNNNAGDKRVVAERIENMNENLGEVSLNRYSSSEDIHDSDGSSSHRHRQKHKKSKKHKKHRHKSENKTNN